MILSEHRLKDSLRHNRKLLDEIYQSGNSRYYNTDIIHDAIDEILEELRRRGYPV